MGNILWMGLGAGALLAAQRWDTFGPGKMYFDARSRARLLASMERLYGPVADWPDNIVALSERLISENGQLAVEVYEASLTE